VTKDIVLKMIEHDKIKTPLPSPPNDTAKQNENYLKEITKAIDTVYEAVSKAK
jgi:hypothetical protein